MADGHPPAAPESTTVDRTSALVAGGLALMAVVGVVTIFSDAIAAVWSPATAATEPAPPPPTGHASSGGSSGETSGAGTGPAADRQTAPDGAMTQP